MHCEYRGSVNTVLLRSAVATMDINWQLCCSCQLDTQEFLQTSKKEGFISPERDLKKNQSTKGTLPSGIKVNLNNLNDGSDIVSP